VVGSYNTEYACPPTVVTHFIFINYTVFFFLLNLYHSFIWGVGCAKLISLFISLRTFAEIRKRS